MKHQEVASINDKLGFTYTIPLNSSFRFGPVYSTDVFHQNTHIYEKVADVLALSPLPKVMCALADVRTTDEKNSLTVNEILVIKRVIRSKLRKKSLEVLSLKSQKPKILPHDCSGHFTLNPKHNQIYLLELVRCIPDPFPSKAVMFLSSDTASNLHKISHSVLNAVVTLTGQKTETSLIASSVTYTTCEEEGGEIGAQVSEHLVDIPVDERLKDVMVVLVDSSDSGLQEILNRKTRTLFETFDVTRVRSWYKTPADTANDATQHVLYASIGRGMKGVGIHVDKPPAAFKNYSLAGREEALYESVYNPSTDDTDSLSPHHFTTSTEYPTQYEQPHLSLQHMSHSTPTAITFPGIPAVGDVRPEVRYDPLPSLAQPALAANRTLRRSRSQYTLPMRDLPTDCYEHMRPQVPLSPSVPPRYVSRQTVEPKLEQLLLSTASLQSQVGDLSHRMLRMEDQLRELAQMNTVTKRLLEGISALSVEASQQRSQSDHSRGTLETLTTESERQRVQNQQYLGTLDLPQVYTHPVLVPVRDQGLVPCHIILYCCLVLFQIEEVLRAMGLPQYITRFRQEQVTGSLLLQCSEGMLREELGIDSLLHCKRLMAVITGHQSVRNLSLKSSSTN